jgi:hypothetical protein
MEGSGEDAAAAFIPGGSLAARLGTDRGSLGGVAVGFAVLAGLAGCAALRPSLPAPLIWAPRFGFAARIGACTGGRSARRFGARGGMGGSMGGCGSLSEGGIGAGQGDREARAIAFNAERDAAKFAVVHGNRDRTARLHPVTRAGN